MEKEDENISEFISNQNYVHIKDFHGIPVEQMIKYQNDVFWYVYNETTEEILAHQTNNVDRPAIYLFQEREDAETWRYIGSKSGTNQDDKLSVKGEKYLTLNEDIKEDFEQFRLIPIDSTEAQNLFENYPEILLTRKFEERRELEGRESDGYD